LLISTDLYLDFFLDFGIHPFTIRGIFRQFCFYKKQKNVSSRSTFLKKLAIAMIFNTLPKQKCKKASNTNNLAKPCHYKPPPLAVLLVNNTNAFRSILVPCQACQRFFFTL
jgi:hypothetical protein